MDFFIDFEFRMIKATTAIWFHTFPCPTDVDGRGSITINTFRQAPNHVCLTIPSPLQRKIEPTVTNVW